MTGETSRGLGEPPGGRGAGLLVIALLATVSAALVFVDAAVMRPSRNAPIELLPGFYAVFGVLASIAAAMLARLLRVVLGRAPPPDTDASDDSDRA